MKVFISFLGTNEYIPCHYYFKSKENSSQLVRFVQEAIFDILCKDFSENDKVCIFLTEKAKKINWYDSPTNQNKGLQKTLLEKNILPQIVTVDIPNGNTADELWRIFDLLTQQIQEATEIVFDITHSFRSIPMLAITTIMYLKALKNISVRGIYYGAFEALGPAKWVAQNIPEEDRYAEILDLTIFDELMEWAYAVRSFVKGGDATILAELGLKDITYSRLGEMIKERPYQEFRSLCNNISTFSKQVATCRSMTVLKTITRVQSLLESFEFKIIAETKPAFFKLLDRIHDTFNNFKGNNILKWLNIVEWALGHNMIQQAYTMLTEMLITYFCDKYMPVELQMDEIGRRNKISFIVSKVGQKRPIDEEGIYKTIYEKVKDEDLELAELYAAISYNRNEVNHAEFGRKNQQTKAEDKLRSELSSKFERVKAILSEKLRSLNE